MFTNVEVDMGRKYVFRQIVRSKSSLSRELRIISKFGIPGFRLTCVTLLINSWKKKAPFSQRFLQINSFRSSRGELKISYRF